MPSDCSRLDKSAVAAIQEYYKEYLISSDSFVQEVRLWQHMWQSVERKLNTLCETLADSSPLFLIYLLYAHLQGPHNRGAEGLVSSLCRYLCFIMSSTVHEYSKVAPKVLVLRRGLPSERCRQCCVHMSGRSLGLQVSVR